MKEHIVAIFLLLLAAVTVWLISSEAPKKDYAHPSSDFTEAVRNNGICNKQSSASSTATDSAPTAPSVAGEVIRLHILADSDNERDQAIKLAIRDTLLPYLNAATLNASTKEEALTRLTGQCEAFTEIVNAALARLGTTYTATVSVKSLYFPIRIYGSQTYLSSDAVIFPPGFYDSVQVVLGSGNGHNWWCLAYPSLCFIDASYDYIPKDSDSYKLEIGTLKADELELLFYGEETSAFLSTEQSTLPDNENYTIYFGSKLWELLKQIFTK